MGTSIELCIGEVSLSYSKNHMGEDYGCLFQEQDLCRRKSDAINYDYYEEHPEEKPGLAIAEELFARQLSRIKPRLEILGCSLEFARNEYNAIIAESIELADFMSGQDSASQFLTFEEFCSLACRYPISDLNSESIEFQTPNRDQLAQGRFATEMDLIQRVPNNWGSDLYWSESSFFSNKLCILSAESMLQVFALNPANTNIEVTWAFGPLVDAGWVQRDMFSAGARRKQKILIATEGQSDSRIIRRALDILRPDVADFFYFIDVDETHHYWGTGNLVKFAEGLLRIDILNQVLFVLDNDAEGVDAFLKLENLNLPSNMRAMLLPDLEEFKDFSTVGPEGVNSSDINGRAAAIECYLDLNLDSYPAAQVLWSNFKREIKTWHGALEFKESYSKKFYSQSDASLQDGSYDMSKLSQLIDALIAHAKLIHPSV